MAAAPDTISQRTKTQEQNRVSPDRDSNLDDRTPTERSVSETPSSKAETAPAAPTTAPGAPNETGSEPNPKGASWVKPFMLILVLGAVVYGTIIGIGHFRFAAAHTSTDNATLTSDVVQIAPQVSGTIKQILVKENQQVHKGDLLVVLDDATYQSAYDQAKANLDAAVATAKGAGQSVALTSETGNAQVLQAQGVLSQSESGISSATADVAKAGAGVSTARATAKGAEATVGSAQASINQAISNKSRLSDAVVSARAQVDTANAGVHAAQASVDAAQVVSDRAARDAERYQTLLSQGAISEQVADNATATARQSKAQLENMKQVAAQANATLAQRQADLNAAQQQLKGSDAAINQARANWEASKEQANAANAGIKQAQASQLAAQQMVRQAEARRAQALGQLHQANTTPQQVAVSTSAQAQAQAKIEQAKAALKAAEIQLNYTKIYAPADGRVSKKTAEIGALVQPGTPLMAVVQSENPWVVANYKETQLAGVQPGQKAEIEVDGLPGHAFNAHVESISAATGSTFTLLPPDNATGNFTKIVQRIPVKIVLEPNQQDMDKLRAGMSVTAIIETK